MDKNTTTGREKYGFSKSEDYPSPMMIQVGLETKISTGLSVNRLVIL